MRSPNRNTVLIYFILLAAVLALFVLLGGASWLRLGRTLAIFGLVFFVALLVLRAGAIVPVVRRPA